MTGKNPAFTNIEKYNLMNCKALRQALMTYVRQHKSERQQNGKSPDTDVNLMSLMFQQPDVFSDEFIVDELIDFLVAGTQTTMLTTQTVLSHFATDRESLQRVRKELVDTIGEKDAFSLEHDDCQSLTYLGYVIQEALRYNPPAPGTSHMEFPGDTQIAGMTIRSDVVLSINIYGLHYNDEQWQSPYKFMPDRFDPSSPLSRTTSGAKRHPMSFLPFSGGKRICFGKTFAEMVLKVICSMMADQFEFKFAEEGKYSKEELPMTMLGQSHFPKLPMNFTLR